MSPKLILQLIAIQIVTFVLIILFLRWLLFSNIGRALKRLQQLNQQSIEKERELKKELERAKRQAENEIQQARTEAEGIKEKARAEGEKESRQILQASQMEAKRIVDEAIKDNQRRHKDFILQMQEKSVVLAMDIIRYIFTEQSRINFQRNLVDELITEIDSIEKGTLKTEGNNVEVISAYPLDEEQKVKFKKALSTKLNKDIKLTENVNQEVIAGLIIKLEGFVVVDGSIKNKLTKILPLLREKAKE